MDNLLRRMQIFLFTCVCLFALHHVSCSTLTAPPLSAVVVAFEDVYDLSLVANSLSDQGIDTFFILPTSHVTDIYENLIEVDVLPLDVDVTNSAGRNSEALGACESLLKEEQISKKLQQLQPTFAIFPALRHDACLVPWAKSLDAIPVIWVRNSDEELYVFHRVNIAIPVHTGSFWSRLSRSLTSKSISQSAEMAYISPALQLVGELLPNVEIDNEHLYSDIHLVFWGADTVLRKDFASLTHLLVEVGCHHCRGAHPLAADIHKPVIEYRLGTIGVLLDDNYETLVRNLASQLPQGRQGQAVIWKRIRTGETWPENVFINGNIDRQDLIGYSRTRVLLSHCSDTELLEAMFHGTPIICFPRNTEESRNAARAVELGFAATTNDIRDLTSGVEIAKLITIIHESTEYRENARKVSLAIRDRPDPAVDRLIFWLRYMARTRDGSENFLAVKGEVRTLVEDSHLFLGIFVGLIIGIGLTTVCFFLRHSIFLGRKQVSKGRYAR